MKKVGMLIVMLVYLFAFSSEVAATQDSVKLDGESQSKPTQFSFSISPFTEVVPVDGTKADELYFRAREWFSKAFVSSNNVLQMDSKERLTLIGKGTIEIPPGSSFGPSKDAAGFVHFTIAVYLKDGRYKYEITDAKHETSFSKIVSAGSLYKSEPDGSSVWFGKLTGGAFEYIKTYSAQRLGLLIDKLKHDMARNGTTAKTNDW